MSSLGQITQTGVEEDDLVMPLIDFGVFLHGDPVARQTAGEHIYRAFKDSGFLYLQNHGIPADKIARAFSQSAQFFSRAQEQKDALKWTTPDANRGYVTWGREKVSHSTDPEEVARQRSLNPDLKESMEIGREGVAGMPNQWPAHLDQDGAAFTRDMQDFFLTCQRLHMQVMSAIGLGMGLGEQYFDRFCDRGDNNLRLLHYPAVKTSVFRDNPSQVRAGEHSDYGSVTLLFQDDVGGLEVKSPRGTWVPATPIPGTIVVNAGDLLARWSNDHIKSTNHRVIQPPPPKDTSHRDDADDPDTTIPARYSVVYFCNPNFDQHIEALPGTWEADGKKYEGVNSGDYLTMRLAATY